MTGKLSVVAGPTVRRRQLGRELQRLQEAAGVSSLDARNVIGCSKARFEHILRGRNVPGKAELLVLVRDVYQAEHAMSALEELRSEADQRSWFATYGLPEWMALYVGLETDAATLRMLELENIPGLLQTEEYMRALYALDTRLPAKDADRRIAVRLKRQERLTGDDPLRLTAVVSEAALVRCARDGRVAGQLERLIERAAWPNIELRVLPFDLGVHVGQSGPFSLLSFPEEMLADVAYEEYAVGGHVIEAESIVSQLATMFTELRGQTLDADESLTMIAQLANRNQ